MPLYRQTPPLPDEPIWRWILGVLAFATVAAALIAIAAGQAWNQPVLSSVAGWSAVVTGVLYVFFRWLGAREARRRSGEKSTATSTLGDANTGTAAYLGHDAGERGGEAGEGGGGSDGGAGGGK